MAGLHGNAVGAADQTGEQGEAMEDLEKGDDEYDDQIEQMIIENGILLHSLSTLLVAKGILKQEEIDNEMDRLYAEMEQYDSEE
jgi:hypothetical protein